ncbi:COP9 signalosome complex subunit 6-like [Malurus melanocephalus]|uniref:COP9 signalosome complex subunit 6-like n=1 Tax=Malurus melanocephalus TaxID=175006 RepID=UPI002547E8E2|nr:COP9 signalosome complex subunit 6-like [Malurus melanocephalus]
MEVDGAGVPQVMAGGVTGSVSVALHPLVILNISDHWIRLRSQEGRNGQVVGALIGRQEGRNIEVMNCPGSAKTIPKSPQNPLKPPQNHPKSFQNSQNS